MKKIKNEIILCLAMISIIGFCIVYGLRTEVYASNGLSNEKTVILYADNIVVKYRKYNGGLQYRRWNETKECWVDPYWIDV